MTDTSAPTSAPTAAPTGPAPAGQAPPHFDAFPELYDRFTDTWDSISSSFDDWVARHLPAGARRAVDLGCGAGRVTSLLADWADDVLAVDVSDRMLELARTRRARDNITYQRRGVLDVRGDDGPFDVVLSVHTLHHVGDPATVLPHVRSLLAPGGTLIVADIIDPGEWAAPEFHTNRAFNDAALVYELTGNSAAAADVVRLLLHPRWLELAGADTPLSRDAFHRTYTEAFPGVVFTDDLNPIMCGAVGRAPS